MNQTRTILTAAGMPRSASTWLYNAIRLLIDRQPNIENDFSYGWIGDWNKIPKKRLMLLKIHSFDQNLVNASSVIFYSYRDVRDAIAAQQRKFGGIASIEWADQYIEQHEKWVEVANITLKYESMLTSKEGFIIDIAHTLSKNKIISHYANNGILAPENVVNDIEKLKYESEGSSNNFYNEVNLFHKDHITDGRYGS